MIGHKYVPSREGGIEIVVEELSTRMASLGHEVTIFNRKRKQYPKIDEYKGCKIKNIFTINKKTLDAITYSFFATLKARKLIKKGLVDVVHFHAEGPCLFLNLLPKKKKRPNTKVVVTIHGLDWKRNKWGGFASKILMKGEKKATKFADEIIVLSNNNKTYFDEKYNRETNYIPNGINALPLLSPNIIKKEYGLSKDGYILFLARIVPEKGLHFLISAWKEIKNSTKTNKKLVIAGAPSHTDDYFKEILEQINNDESIVYVGFAEGQKLQELYSNAYLYVLPSEIEGMPMSLLEALSYKNICLVSDIQENVEVINDKCFTFKSGNVRELKQQLKNIIDMDLITHENKAVLKTWDDVVGQTLDIYKR